MNSVLSFNLNVILIITIIKITVTVSTSISETLILNQQLIIVSAAIKLPLITVYFSAPANSHVR